MTNNIDEIKISKVVINIGVGKSGEPLEKAKSIIREICGQTPVTTYAKKALRELGIQKNTPIGVKTTIRKEIAHETLKKLLIACDGGAASGKTTASKLISKKYGLNFLSSGLLYRYISYKLLVKKKY